MKNLIVVPARGGSKGIPKKNIYPVLGKPLLEYTLEASLKAHIEGDIVVSTDSEDIAAVVQKFQEIEVVKRPDNLSTDNSTTEVALIHALNYMKEVYDKEYDCVVTMQPTSPLRKAKTIKKFIEEFEKNFEQYDSQLTFTETRSDYWILNQNNEFKRLFPDEPRRRQDRTPLYIENSCLYITKVEILRKTKSVLGEKIKGFIIDEIEGVDINQYEDIKIAEIYLKENYKGWE